MVTQSGEYEIKSDVDSQYKKVRGLDAIYTTINELQTGDFKKTDSIGTAVSTIKTQLGTLRTTLKIESADSKDDVIERLTDLKEKGLGGHWTIDNGDWKTTKGLAIIQERLKTQNAILPVQTNDIDMAIKEIKGELARIGIKLNNVHTDHDILDQLKKLNKHLGTYKGKYGRNYTVNLKSIQEAIKDLHDHEFNEKPKEIQTANEAIKTALKAQMCTLDTDVIKTLGDLKDKGMSNVPSWNINNNKAKGLENIKDGLHAQQSELTGQPKNIEQGVTQITAELDELRSELQGKDAGEPKERGVIKNMEFMIKKRKGKGNGLDKITNEIDRLNRETVPDVNKHLGDLCGVISDNAAKTNWQLDYFKEDNIDDKLQGIKKDIHTLSTGDLQEAIEMCDKFLTDADYIKWEKVENIERFVDSEIEKAVAELSKQARRDYVESAKDALKHFAAKASGSWGTARRDKQGSLRGLQGAHEICARTL
ncbi:Extracellular matrix-binding ebh, putative [Babesia ovata]|uniref:Extracellular matrix-binding ebh, putative n=1 Tax=Babesia ovata TaxID=189622 RepID=A0A2H6KIF3_9APIC|nr:Extracellular matrix-binding ebh, putative [Babesia ovata]GBE62774.1 Extracellular matrix-binding ebh, putative [Babesia ovata]